MLNNTITYLLLTRIIVEEGVARTETEKLFSRHCGAVSYMNSEWLWQHVKDLLKIKLDKILTWMREVVMKSHPS